MRPASPELLARPVGTDTSRPDGRFVNLTTGSAIVAFQRDCAGFVNPDGWIGPGKQTIAALESHEMGTWSPGIDSGYIPGTSCSSRRQGTESAMMARAGNEEPEPFTVDTESEHDLLEVLTALTQDYFDALRT